MEEEDDSWALSEFKQTEICVLGQHKLDGGESHVESYLIKVPDPEACPPPDYFYCSIFKLKDKKKPSFSPKELSSLPASNKDKPWASDYFAVIGNMLYAVGGQRKTFRSGEDISDVPEDYEDVRYGVYIPTKDFWILDLTYPDKGWNAGPPMKYRRSNPGLIVVNGKLYVFGGLGFKPKGSLGWMEVFDPLQGTWESLPNPPSFNIHKKDMIHALLDTEAKQEIIVASHTPNFIDAFLLEEAQA